MQEKCLYVNLGISHIIGNYERPVFVPATHLNFLVLFGALFCLSFFVFDLLSLLRVSLERIVNSRYRLQGLRKDKTIYCWIGQYNTPVAYEIRQLSFGAVSQTINLSGLRPPVDINNPCEFHSVVYAVCCNVIRRSHDSRPNVPCCTQQLNIF